MNSDQPGIHDSIRQKFPHLKPIQSPPSLMTLNGFGLSVYGKRDYDRETDTYVKTRCICALFIPLFAVDAYRVADAGSRSWYFLGKESLSSFARSWNYAMGLLLVLGTLSGVWSAHTSSPEYRAKQEIKHADALLKAGEALKAATLYQQQLLGPEESAARQGLHAALETCLESDQPTRVAGAYRIINALPRQGADKSVTFVPDAFQRGLNLVVKFQATDLDGALTILNEAAKLSPTNSAVNPLKITLLKQIIAAQPDNAERRVELALIYEADQQRESSVNVLLPVQAKLGDTEGARILGQYLLAEGKNQEAYALLFPYVQARLEKLRSIESGYTNALAKAYQRALNDLNDGKAGSAWYENYKRASKPEQNNMVNTYVESRMRNDAAYQRAQGMLKEANQIVPVALDLGIVQLNRAREIEDAAARKTELEAAEKTFLAIRGFAGETEEYQMFLGQVYYWLGKPAQGRELFDQVLASSKRAYPIVMSLARTLREVGEDAQARQLCEEAYGAAKSDQQKYYAASLRSRLMLDTEDEIAWLEKGDPNEAANEIELNNARGMLAMRQGKRELAANNFRKAVAGYERMPQSAVVLNNHGLACLNLYSVSGDIADHDRGLALLQEAVSLSPGNSLLLLNVSHHLLGRAYMDVVGDAIHYGVMQEWPDPQMLAFLYSNAAERAQVYQRLQDNEHFKQAMSYLDKALLLAPKIAQLYQTKLTVQKSLRNLPELRKLQQQLEVASPDLTEAKHDMAEQYAGAKEAEQASQYAAEIQRFQKLVDAPEIKNHPPSLEYVHVQLNHLRFGLIACGKPVDARQIQEDARATYNQHPDGASLSALIQAHFYRAHEQLCRSNADYARLADQTRRALGPGLLITALAAGNHSLSPLIRQNEHVLAAVAAMKEQDRRFPDLRDLDEWPLLQAIDANEAVVAKRQLLADEAARVAEQISFALNPYTGGTVLEQYWTSQMKGDETHAREIYQAALKNGVPLPPL